MKHLLNNLSEEEKNRIREQHAGGKKIMIENFNKLVNTKLGDARPLTEQEVTPQTDDKKPLEMDIENLKNEIKAIRKENFQNKKEELKNRLIAMYNKFIAFIEKIINTVGDKIDQSKLRKLEMKKQELIKKRDELKNSGNVLTDDEKISIIAGLLTALMMIAGSIFLPGSAVLKGLQSLAL